MSGMDYQRGHRKAGAIAHDIGMVDQRPGRVWWVCDLEEYGGSAIWKSMPLVDGRVWTRSGLAIWKSHPGGRAIRKSHPGGRAIRKSHPEEPSRRAIRNSHPDQSSGPDFRWKITILTSTPIDPD